MKQFSNKQIYNCKSECKQNQQIAIHYKITKDLKMHKDYIFVLHIFLLLLLKI
jgi:hypothetical protein